MSQVERGDTRYAHILQPIKDLTKNWDVDIAGCLEDYLEELEHVVISFDGGVNTMNFAQAAMLVQSSACVYSKKVEYLYNLVCQVHDMLANKKKQQKSSVDNEGNDEDANFHEDQDDDEFLSLDDLQEGKNLYLKEDFDSKEEFELLPQIPLCLIPLEGEKGENPLLSKKGEVLASRSDFKMNTCCIHPQGTLLLDRSHLPLLEASLKMAVTCNLAESMEHDMEVRDVNEVEDTPAHMSADDNDDGFDHMADDIPLADVSNNPPMETIETETRGDPLRRSERERRPVIVINKPTVDPFKYVDPHEETKTGKPMRRGTVHKLCPGVEDKNSKKRKRKGASTEQKLDPLAKYIEHACYSVTHKFPKNSMKVPTFPELERLYWQEFKRRQALQKEQQKKRSERLLQESEDQEDIDANDDDHVDDVNPLDFDNDDDDIEPLVDDNLFNAIEEGMRDHQSFTNALHQGGHIDHADDTAGINSYEELVRKHVEEYMASAQKYAQITELSKRVAEWEDKVIPRLEEEDRHEPFDINTYGSGILDSLLTGNTVKFSNIVSGKPVYEICRTFLASLMLANTSNVRIEENGTLDVGMDKFELELLSTKRHFEELQDYQAPSLANK